MKTPISAVLVVKNEEALIGRVLDSLRWVEDVVVVDDFSEDRTVEIARAKGARVFQRRWDIEGRHRNWAIAQARYDWVLMIDGDELITPKLARTLTDLAQNIGQLEQEGIYGVNLPMKMFIGPIWVRHPGWNPAYQLRFFNRRKIDYYEEEVHARIRYKDKVRTLTLAKEEGQIIHFSYSSFSGLIDKVNAQTDLEARKRIRLNRRYNGFNAVRKFFSHFLKEYTVRGGWRTGVVGVYISFCAGLYQVLTWFKMREQDLLEKGREEKVIFLDRDGVINRFPGYGDYVKSWEEFEFIPRAVSALRRLYQAGYKIFIVSNQAGVGRGIYSKQALDEITEKMLSELKREGIEIAEVFYCTHRPEEGCRCRKPSPWFLERVLARYPGIDYDRVYMVGDSDKDIEAGKNAGIRTALVLSGATQEYRPEEWPFPPDVVRRDLLDFVEKDLDLKE